MLLGRREAEERFLEAEEDRMLEYATLKVRTKPLPWPHRMHGLTMGMCLGLCMGMCMGVHRMRP